MSLKKTVSAWAAGAALSVMAVAAQAAPVVWDWSPAATGGTVTNNNWTNMVQSQHFYEKVSFAAATQITGMDIFDGVGFGSVGATAAISIRAGGAAAPGAELGYFLANITAADKNGTVGTNQQRLHADIAGFLMQAGVEYWISMSGSSTTFTQTGLTGVAGGDGKMAQFNSPTQYGAAVGIGDMAFRLYGTAANTVPEPASLALVGLGLAGVGVFRRRRAA